MIWTYTLSDIGRHALYTEQRGPDECWRGKYQACRVCRTNAATRSHARGH